MNPALRLLIAIALFPSLLLAADQAEPVSAGGGGFRLESTVGLDSQSCSTERSMALPSGTHEVIVCLRAINGGSSEYLLHDLLNEQLGVLVTDLHYTLGAGSDVYYTFALPLNQNTGIASAWLARGSKGELACKVAWSVVTVGAAAFTPGGRSSLICP